VKADVNRRPSPFEISVCCMVLALGGCGGGSPSTASSSSGSSGSSGASPMTYTVGGTINGLGINSGLVLLNNGADTTTAAANFTTFTLHSTVAAGSAYDISIGKQPYGLTLACTVSDGSGTASANVTSITVTCSNVTPTQTAIAGYFAAPDAVVVDANGNVFVADTFHSAIKKIPYSGSSYGAPLILGSGFNHPDGVAVDASGNVFVADAWNDEIPYSGCPLIRSQTQRYR
jgi:serine/threonine protein kinase, bacterial